MGSGSRVTATREFLSNCIVFSTCWKTKIKTMNTTNTIISILEARVGLALDGTASKCQFPQLASQLTTQLKGTTLAISVL